MPRLSESMTDGKLLLWLVQPGQVVAAGDQIAEIEADKANMEIEAPATGRVEKLHGNPGDMIKVGELLVEMTPSNLPDSQNAPYDPTAQAEGLSGAENPEESPLQKRLQQFKNRETGAK